MQAGDITRLDADVVALKYSGGLFGATGRVANALGLREDDMRRALPSMGTLHVVPGDGRIRAKNAAFLHVAPISSFTHDDIRQFSVDVLRGLSLRLPQARHVGLTLHGVMFGMDLERSLRAELDGCIAAVGAGECPSRLERISIVNRDADEVQRLQETVRDVLPDGTIEAPQPSVDTVANFDVFISFKSEDASYARDVFDFLASHGVSAFFSRESLPHLGSDEYHAQIDKAIEKARHMVLVTASLEHATSQWVEYEWRLFLGERLAGRKSGNLISVIAGDMRIQDLPIGLRNREVIRCDPEELPRLLGYVRSEVDRVEPARLGALPRAQSPVLRTVSDFVVATTELLANVSWTEACARGQSLSLEGQRGWRLPTLEELRLIRQAALAPDRSCYWSSEEASSGEAFYMHFDDGHVGRGPKSFSNGLSAVFIKTLRT